MSEPAKVIGTISPVEPWGMSTNIQSLTEYLGQTARTALSDLHVAVWTAKTPEELTALKTILTGLQTSLLITLATADALQMDFDLQRQL